MKILLNRPEIALPEQVAEVELSRPLVDEIEEPALVKIADHPRPFRRSRGGRRKEKA